ncbi:sulfite reductase (NADPH) flavoprotein alpha-component [Pseudoxanthomonas japonensis]|uniref:sulfite reductase subunit alpha n=1 Tax=Pseudoxanthomonas japonensis TaxID=69284 RepID=UPI0028650A3F|nr:sulfite reductase subunit alpha [Pseudoxanthomonas japonensis]MDR7067767.1 sulfite reductase (NADPH) flavoprotein alpha-component [Pseudoxanthomonas japonensis]
MSTAPATASRGIAPVIGNTVVMLLLAACAWLLAGLHEGDWWQAMPSATRGYAAAMAMLAYAGLVAAFLYRAHARDKAMQPSDVMTQDALWVVHASQTGFAMELADMTATSLRRGGVTVQRAALEHLDSARLQTIERAVFVISTTGEGDPPDPALGFVRQVMSQTPALKGLQYAVLALGDREYTQFCAFGHQLDDWLRRQGAQPLFDLVEVDNGDDSALRHWQHHIAQLGNGEEAPDWSAPRYDAWRLRERVELNPGSLGGPAFHLSLAPDTGTLPDWTAGDIAEIGPRHAAGDVEDFLHRLALPADVPVRWQGETQALATVLACSHWPDMASTRVFPDAQALADACTPLPHREYSIASLPADGALHLLVRLMRRADGTPGLGSGWLCTHAQTSDAVPLRIRRNPNFHPPAAAAPLILIGNGTGLAGLRAHLKVRAQAGATRNWLLFGERQRACDFFHADELLAWRAQGALEHLDLAFSRDGGEHRYVQHALLAQANRLRSWIDEGAAVYVCGSLAGMAPEVDAVLRIVLGDDRVEELRANGRYRRDVY